METKSTRQIRSTIAILAGLSLALAGPFLNLARPHFMLDAILTQEQLKDESLREQTLVKLKQEARLNWTLPTIAGLALAAIGTYGLAAPLLKPRSRHLAT